MTAGGGGKNGAQVEMGSYLLKQCPAVSRSTVAVQKNERARLSSLISALVDIECSSESDHHSSLYPTAFTAFKLNA